LKAALSALNQLIASRVIERYAIGGAIGAAFYIQAMQTEDVDAFVVVASSSRSLLVSLGPIYEALQKLGGQVEREYVRFGVWPLQILTDATALISEAIREAVDVEFEGVQTRVFRAEHLCAIALDTGRAKDYARVTMFLEQGEVDLRALERLAERYGLWERLLKVQGTGGG
jgi:hypothetical protein